jgi:hypothetical protein
MKYPNIKRYPGGARSDIALNLQQPDNPVPLLKSGKLPHTTAIGG